MPIIFSLSISYVTLYYNLFESDLQYQIVGKIGEDQLKPEEPMAITSLLAIGRVLKALSYNKYLKVVLSEREDLQCVFSSIMLWLIRKTRFKENTYQILNDKMLS